MPSESELVELEARRAELREQYLRPPDARPTSNGRGIHHAALICSDVEQTIRFYQDLLGFPLVELVENRDYPGSSHFFFDLGNQTLLGFFDFPGLGLEPGVEALGTVQHIAISTPRSCTSLISCAIDRLSSRHSVCSTRLSPRPARVPCCGALPGSDVPVSTPRASGE